jgi:hypothetical protein
MCLNGVERNDLILHTVDGVTENVLFWKQSINP